MTTFNRPTKVGYKNPPIHSQFKKGQSGNPLGRRKDSRNPTDLILKSFNKKVSIFLNGKKRSVPLFEAMLTRLAHSALQGNAKAIKISLQIVQFAQAAVSQTQERKPMVLVLRGSDADL